MKIERGKLWIVELTKNPSDIVGHEQGLTRPCLVISNEPKIKIATIIPLTAKLNTKRFPHTHMIQRSSKNQLNSDSVALIFHIRSVSHERFTIYIGVVEEKDLNRILDLLKNYLRI